MEKINKLLQDLIIMPEVSYVDKENPTQISVRLKAKFNSSNVERFVSILHGFKWHIEGDHSTYLKIKIKDDDEGSYFSY